MRPLDLSALRTRLTQQRPMTFPVPLDRAAERWAAAPPTRRRAGRFVLAVVAATIVLWPRSHPWQEVQDVMVATRPLAAGTTVTASDVQLRPWPSALLPAGDATASTTMVVGAVTSQAVLAGQPLTMQSLAPTSPAARAPSGWGATPIPLDRLPPIAAGDVLDLHGGDGAEVLGAVVLEVDGQHAWLAVDRSVGDDLARALARGDVQVVLWATVDHPTGSRP